MNPIRYKTKIALLKYLPGMHYLEVPKTVVKALGGKFKIRLRCTLNGKVKFQCGLMALGEGRAYIMLSKKRMKEIGAALGTQVTVELKADKSEFGMDLCDELAEVLALDEIAMERFRALTPGKQRYIIHYVGSVKNSDLRIERAMKLLGNLKKLPRGKESFRQIMGINEEE